MQSLSVLPEQRWLAPALITIAVTVILAATVVKIWFSNRTPTVLLGQRFIARRVITLMIACIVGFAAGSGSAMWQAQYRLDDRLAWKHHDVVNRLVVRIADLPQREDRHYRFVAEVDEPRPSGIPSRIMVSWSVDPDEALPDLKPGQVWRMALILRQPHALRNPHGYDAEGRLFAIGVRATATVRGTPKLLTDEPWSRPGTAIERVRHWMREGMRHALADRRYAPVMIALAMGDQAAVAREDWQIFNRSGITHLVSISGMHVTLIAAFGGVLTVFVWRRARWRNVRFAEYLPAQVVGAGAALWVALFYCLLAGWGVPARRTFFMLAVVAIAAMVRVPLSASRILALAGAVVSLLDPWSTLAAGFWLSFGAVAVLLRVGASLESGVRHTRSSWRARLRAMLREFGAVQGAITLGLVPLLAYLMQQVSLASPVVNVYAIPIVSFLVTPLALACAVLGVMPGMDWVAQSVGTLGHAIFELMMVPVMWMSASSWAILDVAAAPWPWMALALFGVAWAIQSPGLPCRWAGWLLMLPMLCWQPDRPAHGYWTFTALDVGQGSAIVVETATQVWLFDTGPNSRQGTDAGERVVVPFLRARGHRHLDGLVVSHADMDHAGGLISVLSSVAVRQSYSSFDLAALTRKQTATGTSTLGTMMLPDLMSRCHAGQTWRVDGVRFSFLHPNSDSSAERAGNAQSCVLLVEGAAHTALLPGDIGVEQEQRLISRLPHVDLVLAPHHGSKTSSSDAFVRAVTTQHVIAQVGYMNRFGHPTSDVQTRWINAGARFWRTDHHGAMTASSSPDGFVVHAQADVGHRYWHRGPQNARSGDTRLR